MNCLTRSKAFLWAVILGMLFSVLTFFIPKLELLTILNGIFIGIVTGVIIVYSPLIYYMIRYNKTDRVSQLAIGIGLLWLSIAGQKIYWIVWHSYGAPLSWQANYFLSAMSYLAIIGGSLFITAPGYPPPTSLEPVELWGANRKLLLILGAIGGIITFAFTLQTGGTFLKGMM